MSENSRFKKLNDRLNSIPIEEIIAQNEKQASKDADDFEDLKKCLEKGICKYCGNPLTHFSEKKPCFHWLLWQAKGLKKKHFPILFETKSFHQIEAYLRWVANSDIPLMNINDLAEEKGSNKLIEITIKYKELEWSFSCSQGDYEGHKDKQEGRLPHYHFQMKKNGNVVINYNSFHIPFNKHDEFCFAVKRGEFDRLGGGHFEGAGMQDVLDNISAQELIEEMTNAQNEEDAAFRMQTMVVATEGNTISGEELSKLMKEHNETGVPMAKLLQKLKNVNTETIITPGPGIPEIAKRPKRN